MLKCKHMLERYEAGSVTWIDAQNPSQEEVREILETTAMPPELFTDLGTRSRHQYVTPAPGALKYTLRIPVVKHRDHVTPHEVKCLISKKFFVTVRYDTFGAADRFKKEFEVISTLHKTKKRMSGAHLFLAYLDFIYDSLNEKLDYIDSQLDDIEEGIFSHREKEMVTAISEVSRRLIAFRYTTKTHDDLFRTAKEPFEARFGKTAAAELNELHGKYFFITRTLNGYFDSLDEFRDTNLALLSTKQNEIMKNLTIMAFIMFPLTLFASLFGMNTTQTPIVGRPGDFWILLGIMLFATGSFFIYFKYKRWI